MSRVLPGSDDGDMMQEAAQHAGTKARPAASSRCGSASSSRSSR